MTIFLRIVLPLCRPALAVLAIFSVLWRWNDFLWPLVVTDQRPITRRLPMTETRAQHADLLAHWVEASPSVLHDPWREADHLGLPTGSLHTVQDAIAHYHELLTDDEKQLGVTLQHALGK